MKIPGIFKISVASWTSNRQRSIFPPPLDLNVPYLGYF